MTRTHKAILQGLAPFFGDGRLWAPYLRAS